MGRLIINSDDFGIDKETNIATLEGHNAGVITSVSIVANGEAYSHAVKEILPLAPNIGRGVHLNITKGKSLTESSALTGKNGEFNKNFAYFLTRGFNKKLKNEIEKEFRAQIEKVMRDTEIDHIDSHSEVHTIPYIFNIVLKLSLEYGIKNIRLHHEKPYLVPGKPTTVSRPINLVLIDFMNILSLFNKFKLFRLNLKSQENKISTNDYLIGANYKNYMDKESILAGLMSIQKKLKDKTVEIMLHPRTYEVSNKRTKFGEFLSTINPELREEILFFDTTTLTSYKEQV